MNTIAMAVLIGLVLLWIWATCRVASTRRVRVAIALFGGFHVGVLLSGMVRGEEGGMGPVLLATLAFAGVAVPICLLIHAAWRSILRLARFVRRPSADESITAA